MCSLKDMYYNAQQDFINCQKRGTTQMSIKSKMGKEIAEHSHNRLLNSSDNKQSVVTPTIIHRHDESHKIMLCQNIKPVTKKFILYFSIYIQHTKPIYDKSRQ